MNGSSVKEIHTTKLKEIAKEYEAKGYQVLIEPGPEELPDFLKGFQPDLVALGREESVVVEVKVGTKTAASERYKNLADSIQGEPKWRFSLVVFDPATGDVAPSSDKILNLSETEERFNKSELLFQAGVTDAAVLLMWTSVEALLRNIAIRERLPLDRMPSSALIKELFSLGAISRSGFNMAQRALSARNSLVHGFETSDLSQIYKELHGLAQQLFTELGVKPE